MHKNTTNQSLSNLLILMTSLCAVRNVCLSNNRVNIMTVNIEMSCFKENGEPVCGHTGHVEAFTAGFKLDFSVLLPE